VFTNLQVPTTHVFPDWLKPLAHWHV